MDHTWFGVNNHTVAELPPEVMQFGGALSCILWLLCHADPNEGPVYMTKFDISNSFYHLFLEPDNAPKLAMLMPQYDGELQLVAVPLSLIMELLAPNILCCFQNCCQHHKHIPFLQHHATTST